MATEYKCHCEPFFKGIKAIRDSVRGCACEGRCGCHTEAYRRDLCDECGKKIEDSPDQTTLPSAD